MQNGSFYHLPNRAPAETQRRGFGGKRTSDRERESCRLRRDEGFVVRSDDGEGFVVRSDDGEGFVVRSDDGQHRICLVCGEAAALPNAPSGQSPAPKFRAEARTHLKLRLEKNMKKDIKFSTRMASADREKIRALAAKAHMSMSDYVTACCLGKQVVVVDGLKEVLKELKSIGRNLNQLVTLAHMGRVTVINLDGVRQAFSEFCAAVRLILERKRW